MMSSTSTTALQNSNQLLPLISNSSLTATTTTTTTKTTALNTATNETLTSISSGGGAVDENDELQHQNDNDHDHDNHHAHHDNDDDDVIMGDNSDTEALPAKRGMRQRRSASRPLELLAQGVTWIQRWKVPRSWFSVRKQKGSTTSSTSTSTTTSTPTTTTTTSDHYLDNHHHHHHHTLVPLISGLDRVVFGTASAAEAVLLCGMKPPQYLWYMLSGGICDIVQFGLDVALHVTLGIQDASLCWALGFGCSIVFRHTSHRYLVFGDYVGGYWKSLMRMYGGYSIIIVISTVFNIVMTRLANISHYAAWIITLLWTGIVNYFILKKIWSFGGSGKVASTNVNNSSSNSGDEKHTRATTPQRGRAYSSSSGVTTSTPRERTFSSSTANSDTDNNNRNKKKIMPIKKNIMDRADSINTSAVALLKQV